jgi:hypothetical protein
MDHRGPGNDRAGTSRWTWVIDPLDGTRNYISRTGPWSVCIALGHGEQARVAVVHDPVARETFSAVDGGGALLNSKPISRSPGPPLDRALIGVSFHPAPETKDRVGRLLRELLPLVGDIRRIPAALNLALPRLDGGVALDTKLWDIAASALIAPYPPDQSPRGVRPPAALLHRRQPRQNRTPGGVRRADQTLPELPPVHRTPGVRWPAASRKDVVYACPTPC